VCVIGQERGSGLRIIYFSSPVWAGRGKSLANPCERVPVKDGRIRTMDVPEIVHNVARNRFEIHLGREVIGKSFYRVDGERRVFTHTEVEPDYQGHGLATQLVEFALNDTKAAGLRIVALCPTVSAYVAKHREFDDILDSTDVAPS
jgi:predicted GNAT family acetyltransferase